MFTVLYEAIVKFAAEFILWSAWRYLRRDRRRIKRKLSPLNQHPERRVAVPKS